ncbi:MAG TPA: cytochrome c biogenesis heme-transporting ATPase CcmA [Burkholderiales bacterium]|nr:cytochrome c biogenesis heme-transporting ATPase CcmA [Burkholderiales bacterium]
MLEAHEISCSRGNRDLFRQMSFRVEEGALLRIHGANGSGKTSLLRMIAGLSPVESGRIAWQGSTLPELGDEYTKQLAFVGHANALKAYLSPRENLRAALAVQGVRVSDSALREALEEEGLGRIADVAVQRLSAGQQRRVALVRLALSRSRLLWILDEPFSSLDDSAVKRFSERLSRHTQDGGIVVYTTHQNIPIDAPTRVLELA